MRMAGGELELAGAAGGWWSAEKWAGGTRRVTGSVSVLPRCFWNSDLRRNHPVGTQPQVQRAGLQPEMWLF